MPLQRALALALLFSLLPGCRKGSENRAADLIPVVPAPEGTQGCVPGADAPQTSGQVYSGPAIGHQSQIAALSGSEQLYLTGADGSIHLLDFSGGLPPVDTTWVAPGVIEASYLLPAGIGADAQLSGIAVLDEATLVVAEHSSNTLVQVSRLAPNDVSGFAGLPSAAGGFADGNAGGIRFHFTESVPLLAAADGTVFVGDTGNHALRLVQVGVLATAVTPAGSGAPGFADGSLTSTRFDTPSGLAAACGGEILMVESGLAGLGGRRLRSLRVGAPAFFGGFSGSSMTLAGDGMDASVQGTDLQASLATPQGLVSTDGGLVYWVDSATGLLRRHDLATGLSDCPPFADCALATPPLTPGGGFSLALASSGRLYVLDGDAGKLVRFDP